MIKKIPKIENGTKSYMFITSDNQNFRDEDEAEWHEFTVCQLKQRKITFEIPDHSIYSFTNKNEIQKYIDECYGHIHHIVYPPAESLTAPNNYVVIDREEIKEGKIIQHVMFYTLEEFKKNLALSILE